MIDKKEELSDMLDELQHIKREMGDDTLVGGVSQYNFEHTLIDFNEPIDSYNSRDIYPAIEIKTMYIPIPPDSGQFHKNN